MKPLSLIHLSFKEWAFAGPFKAGLASLTGAIAMWLLWWFVICPGPG